MILIDCWLDAWYWNAVAVEIQLMLSTHWLYVLAGLHAHCHGSLVVPFFSQDGATRHVTQYHYTTWPDHGIPTATALVDFWKTVRTSHRNRKSPSPLLVHCRSVLVELSSALWGFPFQNVMLIIAIK